MQVERHITLSHVPPAQRNPYGEVLWRSLKKSRSIPIRASRQMLKQKDFNHVFTRKDLTGCELGQFLSMSGAHTYFSHQASPAAETALSHLVRNSICQGPPSD